MSAQPGQEIAERNPQAELIAGIRSDQFQEQVALALPDNVTPKRFVRIAITALQQNPGIVTCERDTVIRALLQSAAMGLMPDGKEAALVPFKGKAQLIPMIAGYRKIAADYGWKITANVIYEGDEFEYELGLHPTVTHRPPRIGVERGDRIGVYAYGTHRDGRKSTPVVMSAAEVEKVRQVSQQPTGELWAKWTDRAWEKTAGRRLFKELPLADDDRVDRVVRVLASEDLSPREAMAALYGHEPVAGELPPARPSAPSTPASTEAPADAAAEEGQPRDSGDQQVEGGPPVAAPAEPPSTPDFEGEEPPDPSQFQPPRASEERRQVELEAEHAANLVVNFGKYNGLTLAQIDSDKRDPQYVLWLVGGQFQPKTPHAHEVKAAAQAYATAYFGGQA